jgi:hypothetical protein
MWWINKSKEAWKGVSPDVYFAAGFGNYIVIDANDLVVVYKVDG